MKDVAWLNFGDMGKYEMQKRTKKQFVWRAIMKLISNVNKESTLH